MNALNVQDDVIKVQDNVQNGPLGDALFSHLKEYYPEVMDKLVKDSKKQNAPNT